MAQSCISPVSRTPHTGSKCLPSSALYFPCHHRAAFAEVQSLLLAWQPLLNHRVSHPAPQASHTLCKQALSALAWKLLNSDSAGKLSKMERTALKQGEKQPNPPRHDMEGILIFKIHA